MNKHNISLIKNNNNNNNPVAWLLIRTQSSLFVTLNLHFNHTQVQTCVAYTLRTAHVHCLIESHEVLLRISCCMHEVVFSGGRAAGKISLCYSVYFVSFPKHWSSAKSNQQHTDIVEGKREDQERRRKLAATVARHNYDTVMSAPG